MTLTHSSTTSRLADRGKIVAGILAAAAVFAGGSMVASTAMMFAVAVLTLTALFGVPTALDRKPQLDPDEARLEFLLEPLPKTPHLLYSADAEVFSPHERAMVRDYVAGKLSSEGFTEFERHSPHFAKSYGNLEWAENPKRFVQHYGKTPLDRWNCFERGHILDKHAWDMRWAKWRRETAEPSSAGYTCIACRVDFSEHGVYGSELYDSAA